MASVLFCCNDDRGNFTGHVDTVEIADEIRLTGLPRRLDIRDGRAKVSRHEYPCHDVVPWVGNIMWDGCSMTLVDARRLVGNLLAGGWTVEEWADEGPFADLVKGAA